MAKDWEIQMHGRSVVKVEERMLRLSASPRLAPWWVLTLDNGLVVFARPLDITTARDENDAFVSETRDQKRYRKWFSDKAAARARAIELAKQHLQG